MRTDLEYYLSRDIPPDKLSRIRNQWSSAVNEKDPTITCCCGQLRALTHAFRCFYCGEWYCARCAEVHFKAENSTDEQIEKEQGRWQDAIYKLLTNRTGADIDGKGCDSGDPLDFTLAEISQALAFLENKVEAAKPHNWHDT